MNLPSTPDSLFGHARLHSGKVRDLYRVGDGRLLMVASDRLSAFDVVMSEEVPDKGRILTAMSNDWFDYLAGKCRNHLVATTTDAIADQLGVSVDEFIAAGLAGRSVVCRSIEMLPIECIVRARVTGSAWKEYSRRGTIHGMDVPEGLLEADELPAPMFTPSTKASAGHDENISMSQAATIIGDELLDRVAALCTSLFEAAAARTQSVGVVLADTKFEVGVVDGELVVADEVLTPDSSRLWDIGDVRPGTTPVGFDKQPVRDYLDASGWDKRPPPPRLPDEVITATRDRYLAIFRRISGRDLESPI